MSVLLINPGQSFKDGNIWKSVMGVMPPLGLAQIAAYLEAHDVPAVIIDANAEALTRGSLAQRIKTLAVPSHIGITATTNTIKQAREIAAVVKTILPATPVVLGGIHATILPDEVLQDPAIDFVIRGEGEESFLSLVQGRAVDTIQGLSYRSGAETLHNPPREPIKNIDSLPAPAYHLLPMEKYHPSTGSNSRLPALGMVTSRGCPGQCTFCYGQFFGKTVRYRSAVKIVDEIRLLQRDYGIREIAFYDDTFTAVRLNLVDFCRRVIDEKIDLTWSCFSRVDYVTGELLELMKQAGCHQICYGIESGNAQILANLKKKVSLEAAKRAVALTRKAGIEARTTFMLGNPGETVGTMEETIRFAIELNADIALFNITTPYPGTEMYRWASENNYIDTTDWSIYDLARPVMRLPTVTSDNILKYYRLSYKRFYGRPSYLFKRLAGLTSFEKLRMSLRACKAVFFR